MAQLMGDPRNPDVNDGAPTAADDAPALMLETAPVDTSAAVGGDSAAAREADAHYVQGAAHFDRREWAEALKAFRAVVAVDRSSSSSKAWLATG